MVMCNSENCLELHQVLKCSKAICWLVALSVKFVNILANLLETFLPTHIRILTDTMELLYFCCTCMYGVIILPMHWSCWEEVLGSSRGTQVQCASNCCTSECKQHVWMITILWTLGKDILAAVKWEWSSCLNAKSLLCSCTTRLSCTVVSPNKPTLESNSIPLLE